MTHFFETHHTKLFEFKPSTKNAQMSRVCFYTQIDRPGNVLGAKIQNSIISKSKKKLGLAFL